MDNPSKKAPTSKASNSADLGYDPQGSGMDHDAFFAEVAPGVAHSGNMKYKWDVPGNHSNGIEPKTGLKGD